MERYLFTIEYDGTNFSGWQKQNGQRTVQGEIENVLAELEGRDVEIFASGRTDAGVHALAQTAHVDLETKIPYNKLAEVLNNKLPNDISINKVKKVKSDFHARFDIKEKTYLYKVYNSSIRSALKSNYLGHIDYMLNLDDMKRCASFLIGEHDFTAFCSSKTNSKDHVRTIYDIKISNRGSSYNFEITGSGFLYNMVRIIVGTLIDVGRGQIKLEDVKLALSNGDRSLTGKTMEASGLYLKSTKY